MTKERKQKTYKMDAIERDFIDFINALDNDITFRTPQTIYFKEDFINADLSKYTDIINLSRILFIITISYITKKRIINTPTKKIKLMDYIHLKKEIEVVFAAIWKNDLYDGKLHELYSPESFYNHYLDYFFTEIIGPDIHRQNFSNKTYMENSKILQTEYLKSFEKIVNDYYVDNEYGNDTPNYFCMSFETNKFYIFHKYRQEVLASEKLRTLCKIFRGLFNEDLKTYNLLKLKVQHEKLGDTSYLFEATSGDDISPETSMILDKFINIINTKIVERYDKVVRVEAIFQRAIDKNLKNATANYILKELPSSPKVLINQAYYPLYFKIPELKVKEEFIKDVKNLVHSYPHFKEVIDHVALELTFRFKNDECFSLSPIMILGDYGIGKNSFINSLNNIFGLYGNLINFASLHSTFEITGLANAYEGSTPGFLSNVILKNNISNPLVILDEFDKNERNSGSNLYAPFYDLLEKQGRSAFFENYFATYFDLKHLSIIALVNDLSTVPKGIKERFIIFTVKNPNQDMLNPIIKSIYNKIVSNNKIYDGIELTDIELQQIANTFKNAMETNPRKIRKHIESLLLGKFKVKNTWNL